MKILPFTLLFASISAMVFSQNIALPEPVTSGGKPLMQALNERKTTRLFSERDLDMQNLSNLLWAAYGYNRREERKRTAPTSRNYQEMEVYVALRSGLFLYDAWENELIMIHNQDIRAITGTQEYVGKAPLNLIYVANQNKVQRPHSELQLMASHTNSGFIAQNVYLYCASAGLACVVRALFEEEALRKAMNLDENMKIILTQTVGFHAE